MSKTSASLVSIIIPCFNAEKYVARAIQSALDQTYPDCEVIVIDDGSTDKSLDVIKSFGERIRWETGPNRGGCEARNRGIELARGDWIQFLDADDLLTKDCVAEKRGMHCEGNEIAICDKATITQATTDATAIRPAKHIPVYDLELLLRGRSPTTPQPLHSRKMLQEIGGFRSGLRCAQEVELHLRMGIEKGVKFVSNGRVGVLIRLVPTSVHRSAPSLFAYQNTFNILKCAEDRLRGRNELSDRQRDAVCAGYLECARHLWRTGHWKAAREIVEHIRLISPRVIYRQAYDSSLAAALATLLGFEVSESLFSFARRLRCLGAA